MRLAQHQPPSNFSLSSANLTVYTPGRGRRGRFSSSGYGGQFGGCGSLLEEAMATPLRAKVVVIIFLSHPGVLVSLAKCATSTTLRK
jgi:hypothetical protein